MWNKGKKYPRDHCFAFNHFKWEWSIKVPRKNLKHDINVKYDSITIIISSQWWLPASIDIFNRSVQFFESLKIYTNLTFFPSKSYRKQWVAKVCPKCHSKQKECDLLLGSIWFNSPPLLSFPNYHLLKTQNRGNHSAAAPTHREMFLQSHTEKG